MTAPYDPIPRGPSLPPQEAINWRAFGLAMLAHGVLILFLVTGLNWKTSTEGPLQVELWMDGATPVNPPPSKSEPKPEPKPEPTPAPEPESQPEPPAPPPPPPPPPVAKAAQEPTPVIDPEIALEEERKRRAELERAQLEKEAVEKKAKEDAAKEQQRIKHEREQAEKQERDRLEKERKEIERLEREQEEKLEKEEAERQAEILKKQQAAKKAAEEKKKKEEAAKKAVEEKKKKEEEAKKAKEEADKKAKAEADKKAKAEAAKKAAADKALKDAFRSDALGAAGITGGTADRNQAGGGSNDGYNAKVRACVQPGVSFPTPPRSNTNPAALYRVNLKPDGTIAGIKLTRGSGNPNFDRAVETGIRRCSPFPTPPSGKYPGYIDVNYNMYD